MNKMVEILGKAGMWCGQNKYLTAIKNAFQTFLPLTISGAMGVLWCNVLVNADTGLGSLWKPIMALEFLNPCFNAINFASISCITVGITFGIAQEIGIWNCGYEKVGYFPGVLGLACWISVTEFSQVLSDDTLFKGIPSASLGATGLFTGMIIGVLSAELFCKLNSIDKIKIKMPPTVPSGVARAFSSLVPTFITFISVAMIGLICRSLTGIYLNDIISTFIQGPLQGIGASLPGILVIYLIAQLFWLVGIHGASMTHAVREAIFTPLLLANTEAYLAHKEPPHIANMVSLQMFGEAGGSGVTLGLVIAILLFAKREDNRTVASISLVPGLFNINETVTFGIPLVLNPILGIPFVIAPLVTLTMGYVLVAISFCPKIVLQVPWTTPPILQGFLATGGNVMGAVSQAITVFISILIYLPFVIAYEKSQNSENNVKA
ncbi:MAG: PTS sugar transporter subunit IIC [Faecalibacillus sp.]